jgi:formate dehydrogenase iron-sulfur subunit
MHQSSLGSLFLLMPDKLDPLSWSPATPIYYFLSSVVAGTSLVVLIEMWIAKGYGRTLRVKQLAALSKITFISLLLFQAVRIADVIFEGQLSRALTGPKSGLFLVEIALGGLLPLTLLGATRLRRQPGMVALATLLALLGVILNRVSAVFFAMKLNGPMPQWAPQAYIPSVWEWGLSAGMVAAAILLFRLAVQVLPVLPKEEKI